MEAPVYYPIFLKIHGKRCVVIGGGQVALRKINALLECGADIVVISPDLHPELSQLAEDREIKVIYRDYESGDLEGAFIVVAATNRRDINQKVADEARAQNILVNVVDAQEQSDFIIPSLFRRGDLAIAISTAGGSPALAKKIRTRLEQSLGEEYTLLLSLIKEVRSVLKEKGIVFSADVWQDALDIDLLVRLLQTAQKEKARSLLVSNLEESERRLRRKDNI